MKEKIKEIEEYLKDNIGEARKRIRELINAPIDVEREGGIVMAMRLWDQIITISRDLRSDLETLFWINKLKKEDEEEKLSKDERK